jgi:hypothetical protein
MSRRNGLTGYVQTRLLEVAAPETRARSEPLAEWALKSIRLDGRPFTFEGHGYLRAIYDDTSPHVVVCKAAQIGGTTWALLRSFHACLSGLNTIYFFPTRSDVLEFSKSRVGPLIAQNPLLAHEVRDTDTAGLKRIGEAHLYLRGLKSAVQVKSVPADLVVFDELDEALPDAKTRAKERLSHSNYKRIIELSNPSLPDFGIDEAYQASDQRHWHLKCPGCGEWTCLEREFPRKLGETLPILRSREDGSWYRACPKCGAELDPDAGEWVADYPDRETHGYLISQLFSSTVDPGEILQEYRTTRHAERFYNLKIGIAWVDRENRLHPDDVLRLCGEGFLEAPEEGRCVMGVDTGRTLHVVIGALGKSREDRLRIVHLGIHDDFTELDVLMERYCVSCCVIDGLPETHAARAFAARHSGKVYLNFFNEHQRGKPKWDPENRTVQENRTEALDASRSAIRNREVLLPRESPIVHTFAEHLSADAKQLVEDEETGAKQYRYLKTGPNHFGMAFTYAWLAYERLRPSRSALRLVRREPSAGPQSLTAGMMDRQF